MKYVVLSFDDGRKDFYTNALPILKRYNLPASLNIVSDYVGKNDISAFASGNQECMSWEEIRECRENGIEIANHSANHSNELSEILRGQARIADELTISLPIGFASPGSVICSENFASYQELISEKQIQYIRSGNQIRRDGLLYAFLYVAYRITKSNAFYYWYNKRNIITLEKQDMDFFRSVTCNRDNNASQAIHLIEKLPEDSAVILLFHSILYETEAGFGKDKWFNTAQEFEQICSFLVKTKNISVITNEKLCHLMKHQGG